VSNRQAALVVVMALMVGIPACGEEGAAESTGGGPAVAGAGRGGTLAGRGGGGRGGEAAAGRANEAGEGGSAGEGGDGASGRDGTGGSSKGGAPDAGTSGVAGVAGEAAGAGGGGVEERVVGIEGGRVSDAEGDVTLSIPAGALLGDTKFSFAELASLSNVPDGYGVVAGTLHQISWSGAGFSATAVVTVGIRVPETFLLEHTQVASDALLALLPPIPPVSGVSVCAGSAKNYEVEPDDDSYEGAITPTCQGNAGSGGSGGSGGGSRSVQVGLATPQPNRFPTITNPPQAQSVSAGWDVSFSVSATGDAPLTYQWYRDGAPIANAASASYRLGPAAVADHGALFTVAITNRFGTLTSAAARLDVAYPAAPSWEGQRAVLQDFGPGLGAPHVGALLWTNGFAAWNDGGDIEVGGSNYGPIEGLRAPARSAPIVLTLFTGGYVVYVGDDGTSACTGATGNRLMAIGISTHQNQIPVPNSAPFVLYQSPSDCITGFSAGLVDPDPALLPDPVNHDATIRIVPIVYALTELGTQELKLGVGGAGVPTCGFCSDTTWEYAQSRPLTLSIDSACSGPARLGSEGLMGRFQTHVAPSTQAQTSAVLTWVAGGNACAATLDDNVWSQGRAVFDNVAEEVTTVAALDNLGNALVAASRVEDPLASSPTYRMSTSYRSVGTDTWEFYTLDLASAPVPVTTAFTPAGDALLAWVNHWESSSLLLATRRTRAGVWDEALESIADGVELGTGRPRLCVDTTGAALVLFEQRKSLELPLQIWGRQWVDGFWGSSSVAQNNGNAGSDASCGRQLQSAFPRANASHFFPGFVAWREVDPGNPSVSRLVAHGVSL
jgi:hypothetical protein